MTKSRKKIVYDSQGNEYVLTGKVGEGGQGMVCSTDRPGTLVKIINTKDKAKIDKAIKQIQWISQQNISDLNLALPKIAITRPKHGYVMELMDGLISLQDVLEQSFNDLQDNESTEQYLNTGSISRRIKLLLEIASTLSELHSRGYAYGDLSPENIFVSKNVAHSQVWFIDCDNICFNEREGSTHLFTPGYGAPEVVRNEQNINCLTDAWSFAVIAFELLTHQHPYKGLYVEDGEPEIVEQQAFEGQLPWIYDSSDDSNESVGGIPLSMVANAQMVELFKRCFEDGKQNPLLRPSLTEWRSVLPNFGLPTLPSSIFL
jgi:DNA-binding helix-hairpin-helix protein with protein kinase domain